ncbi:hypothetical protein NPIL_303701 [Nephila pilipes]|uniref:Uncharacterized protein n=1 Tax=Nephila pilipes TaxID=299642 RepID=A0A8X6MXM3_NEPPI|nr:hypothetical protein NPIL_303701 [Nephila pilipes]
MKGMKRIYRRQSLLPFDMVHLREWGEGGVLLAIITTASYRKSTRREATRKTDHCRHSAGEVETSSGKAQILSYWCGDSRRLYGFHCYQFLCGSIYPFELFRDNLPQICLS